MAAVTIPDQKRKLENDDEIRAFLKPFGIFYEKWDVGERCSADAADADILNAYAPEIQRVMKEGAYTTVDVINVNPSTPGLDAMCQKFNKEHIHTEDEVRFCIKGSGLFHIHPAGGPVFAVRLEQGDMINVPKGTQHWFDLCETKEIRAIRFFQDKTGWAPHYVDNGVHANYMPICFGPQFVPPGQTFKPSVAV